MNFKTPTGNFMSDFIEGNKKGMYMGLFVLAPALIFMYPIITILQITGLLDVIGRVFGPVMGLFGLPGETAITIISSLMSTAAGLSTVAAYFEQGILDGYQVAVLLPMMWTVAGLLQNTARILNVVGPKKKYYLPIYVIGFITLIIIGIAGRAVVNLLW